METKPYLIFSLDNLYYGIDAQVVQEIFQLPELTPITEAPPDIVGLLNLREKIVPIMPLALRLGHQMQECHLNDSVIVLELEELQIGIIVNSVYEVKNINSEVIETEISYHRGRDIKSRVISGIAKVDADIIILLNHNNLLCYSNEFDLLQKDVVINSEIEANLNISRDIFEQNDHGKITENYQTFNKLKTFNSFYTICCPNATPEEKAIFRERAENLRQVAESSDFSGLMPLAIIGLNGEYFGLDLHLVREFTDIRNVTFIPCCPPHIIGNMNLRGEIVTIVDIRNTLNLPIASQNNSSKAIIIHVGDLVAAMPVDEVLDVMYIRQSEITAVPAALHSGSDEYLRGTAPFSEKMLSILELPKILSKGVLTVNEEI